MRSYSPERGWLTALAMPGMNLTYHRDAAGRIGMIANPVKAENFVFSYNDADWSSTRGE